MEVIKSRFLKLFWSYVFFTFHPTKNSLQTWLKAVHPLQRHWAGILLQARMALNIMVSISKLCFWAACKSCKKCPVKNMMIMSSLLMMKCMKDRKKIIWKTADKLVYAWYTGSFPFDIRLVYGNCSFWYTVGIRGCLFGIRVVFSTYSLVYGVFLVGIRAAYAAIRCCPLFGIRTVYAGIRWCPG